MTDVVAVIQADRDAAAEWLWDPESISWDRRDYDKMRGGSWDEHSLIQAFARHRLAAQTPPDSGEVGELVERLREAADFSAGANGDHARGLHPNVATRKFTEAADALTSLLVERDKAMAWAREQHACADEYAARIEALQARVEQLSAALASIRDHDGVSYRFGDEVREIARTALSPTTGEGKYGNGPTGGEPG